MRGNIPFPPGPSPLFLFPSPPCYICRSCNSVVGWGHQCSTDDIFVVLPDAILLSDIESANVIVENLPFERGMHILHTLFCARCGSLVGWKIAEAHGPLAPIFAAGRYIFFGRCVYFWNTRSLEDPVWSPSDIR